MTRITEVESQRSKVQGEKVQLNLHLQAIVGQVNAGRECCLGFRVPNFMTHVCEVSQPRLEPLHQGNRLIEARMGGVGLAAQGIKNQHLKPFEQTYRAFRDGAEIGDITRWAAAKTKSGQISVERRNGNPSLPPQVKWPLDEVGIELGNSPIGIRRVKDVGKDALDVLHGDGIRVNRDGSA